MGELYDFVDISDKKNLEEAIKELENVKELKNVDFGIITYESNNKYLVTSKVLSDIHEKIDIDSKKKSLWEKELRKKLPPTVIVTISSKEGINENYHSVEIDTHTIKAGAIGAIVIRDEQVKGIIALEDLSHVGDLFKARSKGCPGGNIDVNYRAFCRTCGEEINYHYYNSRNPPSCINGCEVTI